MRKIVAVALWAWIPFCGQPLRGQAPSVGVQKGGEQKRHADDIKDTSKKTERGTAEAPLVVDTQGHKQTKDEAAESTAERNHTGYVEGRTLLYAAIAAYATGGLVLIGLGGVIAAVWTLRAIQAQTNHTINSERAWVTISVTHPPDIINTTEPGTALPANHFVFDIVNSGRTVARLIEIQGESRIVGQEESLPERPQYRSPDAFVRYSSRGTVLAPNASFERLSIAIEHSINLEAFNDLRNYMVFLYVYGFIRYFDFAKEERRLQFCYQYVPSGFRFDTVRGGELLARWVLAGPPDYNSHS